MSALVDLKVPLEALSYRFRKLQKHLSRDTDAEIKRIEDLRDIFSSDEYEAICTRLHGLRSLVISADTAEKGCLERLRARIDAAVEQKLSTEDKTIIMVADYLLRLREFDCVEHLVDEYRDGQLRPHFNIPEHREAHVVEAAIAAGKISRYVLFNVVTGARLAAGDLDPALQWCQSHASKLRRVVSVLEFYISQEKFLDLVYANNPQEALKFAQNHLAVLINTAAEPKAAKRNAQSQASTNEKRLRAVSMGSYASTPDTELARVLEVTAATPSYEEFGCTNNDWSSKRQNIQATPEPELKSNLRCLTSLLVYPSTSPEVMNHPRYGPWARQKRLSKIQEIFQNDFRQVYGFPEISPLETYLTTGVAVLKTPTCSAILNGGELNYAGKDSASSTTNAFSAIVSNRLRDSAPIGVDQASSGDSRQRPAAPFFDRLSNIGNLLNSNSRRARSQSLSAIEEKFDMVYVYYTTVRSYVLTFFIDGRGFVNDWAHWPNYRFTTGVIFRLK